MKSVCEYVRVRKNPVKVVNVSFLCLDTLFQGSMVSILSSRVHWEGEGWHLYAVTLR